jgi:methionyl-tRNA synthetase
VTRTVLSGIAKHYKPEALVGRQVVLLYNLAPRKRRNIESQGMILASSEGEPLRLLTVDGEIADGSGVS